MESSPQNSSRNSYLVKTVLAGLFLLLVTSLTNPTATHPLVIIAVFVLLFLAVYFGLRLFGDLVPSLARRSSGQKRLAALAVTGVVSLMLILQSIGQLTIRDVASTLLFCVILYFYTSKVSKVSNDGKAS